MKEAGLRHVAGTIRCPCAKKSESRTYSTCCQPYHDGSQRAPTPEALMRSRYSAFVLRNEAYLLATWHPTTRPAGIPFDPGQEWLLLRVIATSTTGDTATVEFSARSRTSGRTELLHENSRFVREGGHWLYLSGTVR